MRGVFRLLGVALVAVPFVLAASPASAQEDPYVRAITKMEMPPPCVCLYEPGGVVVVKTFEDGPGLPTPVQLPDPPPEAGSSSGGSIPDISDIDAAFGIGFAGGRGGSASSPELRIRTGIKKLIRQLG
jgi:hypothetical protein